MSQPHEAELAAIQARHAEWESNPPRHLEVAIIKQMHADRADLLRWLAEADEACAIQRLQTDIWFMQASAAQDDRKKAEQALAEAQVEVARLKAIIDTPETDDFIGALAREAEHARQRWDSDDSKTHSDWFWLLGYLGGKALFSALAGDMVRARHHAITAAGACLNWHQRMSHAD